MSQNDSVEEIIIDQPVSIQTTVTDGVVSNINVDPPKTNEEKVVEWINRNEYVDETESVENEEVVSTIFDHEQDELATLERTTENLIADEVSGKDTTINTSLNTLHVQHSILHHAYHTQLNPPKQSYMRALPSQKVWSRDLRRIASASTQPESTQTTEPKASDQKCLTPKRKGILIGSIFGALVVAVGLSVAVTYLIELSSTTVATTSTITKVMATT